MVLLVRILSGHFQTGTSVAGSSDLPVLHANREPLPAVPPSSSERTEALDDSIEGSHLG